MPSNPFLTLQYRKVHPHEWRVALRAFLVRVDAVNLLAARELAQSWLWPACQGGGEAAVAADFTRSLSIYVFGGAARAANLSTISLTPSTPTSRERAHVQA